MSVLHNGHLINQREGGEEVTGPHPFTETGIDDHTRATPGAYILTRYQDDEYIAKYAGRSDDDVNGRLKEHLPDREKDACIRKEKPTHSYVTHTSTAQAAYEQECRDYHEYSPTCNKVHPKKTYSWWSCPVCGA